MSLLNGKTAWRVHERARSGLLIDGRDYFLAFHRAAREARRSILLLGWQFDSDVELLRGSDLPEGASREDVELLRFLDGLCRERPELEVRVLAWDHSVVFALEREVLQKLLFDVVTSDRFHFRWDGTVPLGGSHHQKVAIIDGRIAFCGSQDLCHSRWDDSSHRVDNPERVARFGFHYKPYHEVQAVVTGAPARTFVELFVDRWRDATGEELDPASLVAPRAHGDDGLDIPVTLPFPPARVGISRTLPDVPGRAEVREVRELLTNAIASAERLVYVESQYVTSCAVRDALVARMRDRRRPPLEVVFVLPRRPERFKEEFTVGWPQAQFFESIVEAGAAHGHSVGLFDVAKRSGKDEAYVYVHSKLMIVDDRFMTVGSANLTNRSMTIDSEANLSWEARTEDRALRNAIRRARVRLLLEHVGPFADASRMLRAVVPARGLVARLEALCDDPASSLRRHDRRHEEPSALAKAVQELACEVLDPTDEGAEGPLSRPSAA